MPNAIDRTVDGKVSLTIKELNNHFSSLEVNIADNSNIGKECLRREDLHLIERGSGKLLINFINKMKSLWRLNNRYHDPGLLSLVTVSPNDAGASVS